MKKILLMAVLALQAVVTFGQSPPQVITYNKSLGVVGGQEGKNYAVIISTTMPKRDLVASTTKFLAEYGLVDEGDVKLDEIDESTGEYTVPFYLPQPMSPAKMMGMPIVDAPIKVYGQLRFEFHEQNVMVVVQNLSTVPLIILRRQWSDGKPALAEDYHGEQAALLMAHSFVGKMVMFANGVDSKDAKAALDNYFADIDARYKVYNQIVADGDGRWMTNEEYVAYETAQSQFGKDTKNYQAEINGLNQWLAEHRMFLLSEKRWENHIRVCFDNLFRAINAGLGGKIAGVAEDGNQTWAEVNGQILPTDPKLQKTYLKKGLSYDKPE